MKAKGMSHALQTEGFAQLEVILHNFFGSLFSFFFSPLGIAVLAILDTSVLFYMPFAVDAAVIVLAARDKDWFWVYPVMAALGSIIGAAWTYAIGRKIGEGRLERFMPRRRLARLKEKVRTQGAVAMAVPALIPPPFPFTPFILTCGALEASQRSFLTTLAAVRLLRYGGESLLAVFYGGSIIRWMDSEVFRAVVWIFFVLIIAGTAFSTYKFVRGSRRRIA
jgi:membrane protein YqaA with SNARE-associated domain